MTGLFLLGTLFLLAIAGVAVGYLFFSDDAFAVVLSVGFTVLAGLTTYWWDEIQRGDPVMAVVLGLLAAMAFCCPYMVMGVLRAGTFLSDS